MPCLARACRSALVALPLLVAALPVSAQDLPPGREPLLLAGNVDPAAAAETTDPPPAVEPAWLRPSERRRPKAMLPLYASFGTLQALDAHSTARALNRGAVEANPVMRGAGNAAGPIALKAAGAAAVIYASEKLWKKKRRAAVVLMIAANAAVGFVVQHNYRNAR